MLSSSLADIDSLSFESTLSTHFGMDHAVQSSLNNELLLKDKVSTLNSPTISKTSELCIL